MDYSMFHPVEQAEMLSCVMPILFKCFDAKPIGTDLVTSQMDTIKAYNRNRVKKHTKIAV